MDRTLFDYLTGAGEVAATLGTGALAGFAGPAYGIYKGVTSPNYGTIEGGREADRAAMDLMSKMTYQPRGEVAQNLLGSLGQAMDAAKIALEVAATADDCTSIFKVNHSIFEKMKLEYPDQYDLLIKQFKARKAALSTTQE